MGSSFRPVFPGYETEPNPLMRQGAAKGSSLPALTEVGAVTGRQPRFRKSENYAAAAAMPARRSMTVAKQQQQTEGPEAGSGRRFTTDNPLHAPVYALLDEVSFWRTRARLEEEKLQLHYLMTECPPPRPQISGRQKLKN